MTQHECIHEDQLQGQSRKIAELETRADYKDERITQILEDQKRMEDKIDKIAEAVNNLQLQSLRDDRDIDKRVTTLETTVRVIKYIIGLVFGSGLIWVLFNFIR